MAAQGDLLRKEGSMEVNEAPKEATTKSEMKNGVLNPVATTIPLESVEQEPRTFQEMMAMRKKKAAEVAKAQAKDKPKEEILQCELFLVKKRRQCRLSRMRGARYCAEHIHLQDDLWEEDESQIRIPCPFDSNHTVQRNKLAKHQKKCNSRPLNPTEHPYYRKSINSERLAREEIGGGKKLPNALNIHTMPEEAKLALITKVINFHRDNVFNIKENHDLHPLLKSEFVKTDVGESALKHRSQNAALVNIMQELSLFQDNTCYIEYGSGRGGLSYEVIKVLSLKGIKNCKVFLIDVSSPRYKHENKAKGVKEYEGVKIERVKINVEDLFIGNLGGSNGLLRYENIVGMAKHLCGSATDVALKSLLSNSVDIQKKVLGFVFATCCHHRIEHVDYFGSSELMPYFKNTEFSALKQFAAWATDGQYDSSYIKNESDVPESLSKLIAELEESVPQIRLKHYIGRLVKEIFDDARRRHINKTYTTSILYCRLVRYVKTMTTPENLVICGHVMIP